MASTPVEFWGSEGKTLTLELYPYGSDTIANGAGDSFTEETNRKGVYLATVTEAIEDWHTAHVKEGSTTIAIYGVRLHDTTAIHRLEDPQHQAYDGAETFRAQVESYNASLDFNSTQKTSVQTAAAAALTAADIPGALQTAHGSGSWQTATGFSTHSAADVWAVGTRTLTANTNFNDPSASTIAASVWAAAARTLTANTNFNDPTAAAIADAVWDELLAGHRDSGKAGQALIAAAAVVAGKIDDAKSGTETYRDLTDAFDAVTITVASDGNRTAVAYG